MYLHSRDAKSYTQLLQVSVVRRYHYESPRPCASISFGEVSEACHRRRIRQELSEPSAVSSLNCEGGLRSGGWSVPLEKGVAMEICTQRLLAKPLKHVVATCGE
jgi:hypothetical protein